MPTGSDEPKPNVGIRLRMLRERHGLSLRALAQVCGLSINAISRIERGDHSPTVSSLHQLAKALNVPITAFFEDSREQTIVFVRRDKRLQSEAGGIIMESLGVGLRRQQLEPFLVRVNPGVGTTMEPVTHAGEEFVYCLEGTIEYRVNDEVYPLEAGDSLLFEATQPHCFHNGAGSPATLLMMFQATVGSQRASHHHVDR